MAKRDDTGLKSENHREAEAQVTDAVASSSEDNAEASATTEDHSPTITMQGVSGKKITGKVRAVRAVRRVEPETEEPAPDPELEVAGEVEAEAESVEEEPTMVMPRKIASGSEIAEARKRAEAKAQAEEQAQAQARAAAKRAADQRRTREADRSDDLQPITGAVPTKLASGSEVRAQQAEEQRERRRQRAVEREEAQKRAHARAAQERAAAALRRREEEVRETQARIEQAQRESGGPRAPRAIDEAKLSVSGPRKLGNIMEQNQAAAALKAQKAEEAKASSADARSAQTAESEDQAKKRPTGSARAVAATQALERRHRKQGREDTPETQVQRPAETQPQAQVQAPTESLPRKISSGRKKVVEPTTPDAAAQVVSSRPEPPKTLEELAQAGRFGGARKIASGGKVKESVDPSLAETAKRFAKRKAEKAEKSDQDGAERDERKTRQRRKREDRERFDRPAPVEAPPEPQRADRARRGRRRGDQVDERSHEQRRRREEQAELARQRGLTGDPRSRRKQRRQEQERREQMAQVTHVSLPEALTVKEFAEAMKKTSSEVIMKLMGFGVMATLNQEIDYDTAVLIADEFGIQVDKIEEVTEEDILFDDSEDIEENLLPRAPVVVVMGHVDHGKTSLLDSLRSSDVAAGEAGGITQHIGASMVTYNDRPITFLDTPGHEAFTTMRARGADATDIAILVVAADDGVMPQTVEAINHAKAAGTDIIVAINKIDKPDINIDHVKQQLSTHGLIPEDWGGETIMVPVSAHTGEGIDELMDMLLLTADVLELKADPERQAKGIVLEARLDRSRGVVATLLVQRGTLRRTDTVVTSSVVGNIRAMINSRGEPVNEAGPSMPVEILGLSDVPEAGEVFYQVDDERTARQLADRRRDEQREQQIGAGSRMSLDALHQKMAMGEIEELKIVVKADVVGSVEAMRQSLENLSTDEVRVDVIHGAVGGITESDIRLAEVANAIVIGFNVRPTGNVEEMAKSVGVDLRLYRVIYEAIEDIENAMVGLLEPELVEKVQGRAEIRDIFHASSVGTIGGGYVLDGKITRSGRIRLIRDDVVIMEGELASLRRYQDDVREVNQGYECGLSIERFNDIKVGDIVESFIIEEHERTL